MKENQKKQTLFKPCAQQFKLLCLLGAFICCIGLPITIYACGWDIGTEHSVRFNPYRLEQDFARLPRLPRWESAKNNRLFSWGEDVGWVDYEEKEQKIKAIEALFDRATMEAERGGDLVAVRNRLHEFLQQTSPGQLSRHHKFQQQRNSAFDMLDALTALDQGSSPDNVRAYLIARMGFGGANADLKEKSEVADDMFEGWTHFQVAAADKNLRDNTAYLKAASLYVNKNYETAEQEFVNLYRKFPKSEKREAAMFMAALCALKQSQVYVEQTTEYAEMPEACLNCKDEYWEKASAGFQRVMSAYPKGRYYDDAQGWLAHLSLRIGDRVNALAVYFRMLGSENEAARLAAVCSLRLIRHKADEAEMERVEKLLEGEPSAALAYAYYSIYNFAAPDLDFYSAYQSVPQIKERENREFQRIAQFATRVMQRYSSKTIGGAFVLRVAEANLQLNNFENAARLARQALGLGVTNEYRAEALWVAGVAEHHLKKYPTAREALTRLIQENPNNRYTEGARRNLALLEEDAGNLDAALLQYLALDYRIDVAYFIDVLMKPEALKQFIDAHPNLQQRDELLYALGVRYLRDFRWPEAREIYAELRPLARDADYDYLSRGENYDEDWEEQKLNPKDRSFDPQVRGIRAQWIEKDLRTLGELERWQRELNLAPDDESKAEALYQFASYIYEEDLLFYNPLAWGGNRHYLIYELYNRSAFRQGGEGQHLLENMQKHDMASRALEIYLEVVKKYPNTRAARDALYSAAVCHERLQEYNNYWRGIYAEGGHAGERSVSYQDVKRAYPDYRFPLGTFGWEPKTRTVNGGPGWVVLPKPKPTPTLKERAFRNSKSMLKKLTKKTRKTVGYLVDLHVNALRLFLKIILGIYRCLWFGCAFVFSCLMFGWASESRKLLRDELSKCEALIDSNAEKLQSKDPPHWVSIRFTKAYENGFIPDAFYKYISPDVQEACRANLQNLFYKIKQLVEYERGKSLLTLTAATYSILVVLLLQVLTAFK